MSEDNQKGQYAKSGVDVDKNERVVSSIKSIVESTHTTEMRNNPLCKLGDFSGIFPIPSFLNNKDYHLTATMDGVGTKSELVKMYLGDIGYINLGKDIVNHCINDTLAGGGKPLFFLDYYASSNLKVDNVCNFIKGVSEACKLGGVALLGGETAEMPGIYQDGKCDLVGCMIGYQLTKDALFKIQNSIKPGDVVFGFPSNGPHTNGYSVIRKAIEISSIWNSWAESKKNEFLDICCRPHLSYLEIFNQLENTNINIKSSIHITGGGWIDNPPRILNDNVAIEFKWTEWINNYIPQFFKDIKEITNMGWEEMLRVFNCGIGLMVIVSENDFKEKQEDILKLGGHQIGYVVKKDTDTQTIFN